LQPLTNENMGKHIAAKKMTALEYFPKALKALEHSLGGDDLTHCRIVGSRFPVSARADSFRGRAVRKGFWSSWQDRSLTPPRGRGADGDTQPRPK
jgi:hypothetical protein